MQTPNNPKDFNDVFKLLIDVTVPTLAATSEAVAFLLEEAADRARAEGQPDKLARIDQFSQRLARVREEAVKTLGQSRS